MANEPERPIEKLLRDCARKRREEARDASGFELHPATRRLFQGEVARRFPRRGESGSGSSQWWLVRFWPRLIEGCVLVALVAVVASLLVPAFRKPKGEALLAKNEESDSASRLAKSMPAPAAPAPTAADEKFKQAAQRALVASADAPALQKESPALKLESGTAAVDKDSTAAVGGALMAEAHRAPAPTVAPNGLKLGEEARKAPAAPAASPVASPANSPAASSLAFALDEKKQTADVTNALIGGGGGAAFAFQAPSGGAKLAPPASLADASSALSANYADAAKEPDALGISQRFTQVPPVSKAKAAFGNKAAPLILASFQVEQSGPELKIIDSDGSVYTGFVQANETTTRARLAGRMSPAEAATSHAPAREDFRVAGDAPSPVTPVRFFRVTGTNRSLGQAVVFSGNLTGLTNAVVSEKLKALAPAQTGTGQIASGRQVLRPLLNSRISGQVVIGRGQAIQVNAVPAP